jgi:hypothetical protein
VHPAWKAVADLLMSPPISSLRIPGFPAETSVMGCLEVSRVEVEAC